MKKAICLLLALMCLLSLSACERNSTNLRKYENYAKHNRYLPKLDEIGDYREVKALRHHDSAFVFFWDAYHLIVSYDEAQYQKEKAALEERYLFREKPVFRDSGWESAIYDYHESIADGRVITYPPYCDLNGYHLRILNADGLGFPKEVYFIGTNDEAHKIIYSGFYDSDLDSIDSLESFLMDECGWSVLIEKDML